MLFQRIYAKGSGVFMQEQRRSSYSYRSARRRRFSPVALIVAILPFVLVLFLYTRAWDAAPRFAFPWNTAQWFAALLPVSAHTTQPARPTFSRSWYIEGSVASKLGDMQALGQQDVRWMLASQQCSGSNYGSLVILDFGEPHTSQGVYGTYTVKTNHFWSDTDIADGAKQYMMAWHTVSSACRLELAIGLSNHHQCAYNGPSCSITEVGTQWADTVNSLNTWVKSRNYDKQIQVWGAYDAETTWDGADRTRQFVDGFNGNDAFKVPLVDFGDMRQGDPLTDPDTGQAEQRWTDEDRYYVAFKAGYDVPLPEIYDGPDLHDWVRLQQVYPDLNFLGIMTEACSAGERLSPIDPRVDCGSIFNGYGFPPVTALSQLKQNILQKDPLYYVTSMPVPF
ncbi:MAG: hypothetical protein AUH94_08825 [Ktedonobacter sp. 13_2_20CM_2_54_8]|nr:MAG: hypothetical protein AUH05_08120 [Ktedonobacter sp. 13_2_20CM_53_11]OLB59915.1 MAG: hypothetical protein AUH94_08825 [Ktedonobacter sp. 13_2_20CM_2_54_8]